MCGDIRSLKSVIAGSGSVAQIARDSLRDSTVLVGVDEQAHTSDLPHDELALLQRRPQAAWIVVDLVRSLDAGAGRANGQVRASADVCRCRDPGLFDTQGVDRIAAPADYRDGGKSAEPGSARLAGTGFQNPLPPREQHHGLHPLERLRPEVFHYRPLSSDREVALAGIHELDAMVPT